MYDNNTRIKLSLKTILYELLKVHNNFYIFFYFMTFVYIYPQAQNMCCVYKMEDLTNQTGCSTGTCMNENEKAH